MKTFVREFVSNNNLCNIRIRENTKRIGSWVIFVPKWHIRCHNSKKLPKSWPFERKTFMRSSKNSIEELMFPTEEKFAKPVCYPVKLPWFHCFSLFFRQSPSQMFNITISIITEGISKNYNEERYAGCARSRYTLKLSLIF